MKKILFTFLIFLFTIDAMAQQWVLDEIADEQREDGSNTTPIPGLVFFAVIIYLVYLWEQHKKQKIEAQAYKEQKQEEERIIEKIRIKEAEKANAIAEEMAHEKNAIDLGLSVKWADRNLYAEDSTDIGAMFAWGDNEKKAEHNYSDALLNKTHDTDLAHIIGNNKRDICGNQKFDPASNNWGENWRLPQAYEIKELLSHCTWKWEMRKNVYGYKVIGENGNSIFLPITGKHVANELRDKGHGYYWTGTGNVISYEAKCLHFDENSHSLNEHAERWQGFPIRPVWAEPELSAIEIIASIDKNLNRWNELSAVEKFETYKLSFRLTQQRQTNDYIGDLDRHACYSDDGKRLESFMTGAGRDNYKPSLVPKVGTEIICDYAYDDDKNRFLESRHLIVPNTVYAIGNGAFAWLDCPLITLPKSLRFLTGNPVTNKLTKIESTSPYFKIEGDALVTSDNTLYIASITDSKSTCKTIIIPEKVEIIGRNAIYGKQTLERLVIAKSVQALSDLFIQGCDNLKTIEFLGAIKIIDKYSFNGCKSVKVIIVPDEYYDYYLHFLPEYFQNRIYAKSSVVSIDETIDQIALENDKKKNANHVATDYPVYIPSSEDIAAIKKYKEKIKKTFIEMSEWDDAISDWGTHENEPHESWDFGEAKYSKDGTKLMRHYSQKETYTIKNGTKIICDYAFGDSRNIENIIIPGSVTCLGDMVFYFPGPKKFRIPKSIRTITGNPFVQCSVKLSCDSTYFTIEGEGLYDRDKQVLISIYNGYKYRNDITVNRNIKIIGRNAFYGVGLSNVTFKIPNGVIYIADNAFKDSIMDIELPTNLIEIGDSAFEGSRLKSIDIPDSVQKIGQGAFKYCKGLKDVRLSVNNKIIERETFCNCDNLEYIKICDGCQIVKSKAFWGCSKLSDIYLPDSLKKIEQDAFGCTHLSSVVLSSKTIIEENAFPTTCKIIYRK